VAPWLSRTVSVAVKVPGVEYTCVAVATVASAGRGPPPKPTQWSGVRPEAGIRVMTAVGPRFGGVPTLLGIVAGSDVAPWLSRTVSVAVKVPGVEYTCDPVANFVSVGPAPSPKSQT